MVKITELNKSSCCKNLYLIVFLKYFMWKVKKSKIHGSGVFATQSIKKNTHIIEYIGEKITKKEGDKRSEKRIKKYLNFFPGTFLTVPYFSA